MFDLFNSIKDLLKGFFAGIPNTSSPASPAIVIPPSVSTIIKNSSPEIKNPKRVGNVMETVTLVRGASTDDGTFGKLTVCGKTFYSLELPWKDNHPDTSCIPVGTYECVVSPSARMTQLFNKDMYHVTNVPKRDGVCIHPSNYAGDTSLGKRSDLEGCIAVGDGVSKDEKGQKIIVDSRVSITEFMKLLNNQPFQLVISNA